MDTEGDAKQRFFQSHSLTVAATFAMRLFLLPISTRRTLIYCERVEEAVSGAKPSISERVINRVSSTWAEWEKKDKGWQRQLTNYGNQLFKRIPYEEWGLKSIPPATKARLAEVDQGKHKFECLYPSAFMQGKNVSDVLRKLATERQSYHNRSMWVCLGWMPITIPFTFVPVIPNIPFFYLGFRAWSHYRALYGGKLLEHVLKKDMVRMTDSKILNEMYARGLLSPNRPQARDASSPSVEETERVVQEVQVQTVDGKEDVMLLQQWNAKLIAEAFKLPEMQIEIERAVEQVETAMKKAKKDQVEDKQAIEKTKHESTEKTEEMKR
ncbi:hypothetical protein BAUCODRAFT_148084 [Baudoinia panamericana UAMH 10762]|uniref:Mitochondrial K+-H+ exchange-related-domain-containing protein n=1 Tax=Baudoinia panamericana (strain UAMH 10762) TaxID=717646 RepID=M2MIJ4_BAUPA|nr:uncharacterized protein BAUCODRAFT_148084 [Baudoinia panamericana UAMH 10762]EMC96481.1 hypothetical protein BAUCODRAFT_148084 [Baudoinia panamericana UAMH 10762]